MTALHKNIRIAIKLECNEFKNWDGWFFLRFQQRTVHKIYGTIIINLK